TSDFPTILLAIPFATVEPNMPPINVPIAPPITVPTPGNIEPIAAPIAVAAAVPPTQPAPVATVLTAVLPNCFIPESKPPCANAGITSVTSPKTPSIAIMPTAPVPFASLPTLVFESQDNPSLTLLAPGILLTTLEIALPALLNPDLIVPKKPFEAPLAASFVVVVVSAVSAASLAVLFAAAFAAFSATLS